MKLREIPNIITVIRILLVFPVIYFLYVENYLPALILFTVAGVSDGLDGFLARQMNWQSRLGSILDPLADKMLLVSCFVMLAWSGKIDQGLVIAVILRDLVIVIGAIAFHYLVGRYDMAPSMVSKLNTLCQIVLVFAVLVSEGAFALIPQSITILSIIVWVTTCSSGAWYVWKWGASAMQHSRSHS